MVGPRRVVVTGLGVVCPHGDDVLEMFEAVYAGRSAIRLVETGDERLGARIPLAATDFDPDDEIPKAASVFMARAAQMALVATGRALTAAGLAPGASVLEEAGIFLGSGLGGSEVLQRAYRTYFVRGRRRIRPATVPMIMASGPASHISMRFGIRGPTHTYSVACASAAVAIGEAFRSIRHGYTDLVIAGGAEAMLNDGSVAAWESVGVVAQEHALGAEFSSRPFDAERSGLVLGEGSAILVLEAADRAEARGAVPLAEIVGFGSTADAHHLTDPTVEGQVRCMRAALAEAGVEPCEVGYVNAHATGTLNGDPVEIEAMKRVFGDGVASVPISSTKAVHGHLVGASAALEGVITILALQQGRVPPTAHLTAPDPACDLDCVPIHGREAPDLSLALSNSFAFGGSNVTLAFRRV